MRRIRLFTDQPLTAGASAALTEGAAEHAIRVLRLGDGDKVVLFNGDGRDYEGELAVAGKREAQVHIDTVREINTESPLRLTLAQGVARGDKMDLVVQKATELGVERIVPLLTRRGEVRLDARRSEKRLQHWRAVAISACEQCGRARLPAIEPVQTLDAWLGSLGADAGLRLALLPEASSRLGELDASCGSATVVIGPEGGLDEHDVAQLRAAGFEGLRLGPRILRTETAGLATLAALQARFGDY